MEVSVLGFPRKDLCGDPGSSKDSQKEGDKHKAVDEGQCILKLGEQAGPEGHLHGVRVRGVFSSADIVSSHLRSSSYWV